MRWLKVLLIASLVLTACAKPPPPAKWTTGFWFWQGRSAGAAWSGELLDVLFVHVGDIRKDTQERWRVKGELPDRLPPAKEYWLVFRFTRQGVPDLKVAAMIAREVAKLRAVARERHLNVVGLQLDIDCPTGALPRYAGFLGEMRNNLPKGFDISITALLDWFRAGTAVAGVIAEIDEFVPQFYDAGDPHTDEAAIAAPIDAARWGPVFNHYRKRFRIGISSFGRARIAKSMYGDLTPLDIATNPAMDLIATRNAANELVLSYRAAKEVRIGSKHFEKGETLRFILATQESVRAATEAARQMKGYLAGVVFFRWPSSGEALAMQPEEVLAHPMSNRVLAIDGHCAAVECVDVYLEGTDPFSPKPLRYRIRTSTELAYFMPEKNMPVRMTGPSQLELRLPPYCARGRLYLGRAVSAKHAEFTLEEDQ